MATSVKARVIKANVSPMSQQIYAEDDQFEYLDDIIKPPYNLNELKQIGEYSSILQQCVDAYKTNIINFGIRADYKVDINSDEVSEQVKEQAKQEYERLNEFIQFLSLDESPETVLEHVIDDREKTGNSYIEIIRDSMNTPSSIEYADAKYIRVCKKTDAVEVAYNITENGKEKQVTRKKKFRKYVQQVGNDKVWFKECGDRRIMDSRTGEFDDDTPESYRATELFHFKIGSGTYGVPRWIGNVVSLYGARKAEELNFTYFKNGRHIPAAITVSNGQLDDDSYNELQSYMNGMQGVDNAYKFLLLEAQGMKLDSIANGEEKYSPVKVEIKSLAEVLQKDALFLEYDENTRKKIRSSFRLPPLYTGESQEFSRATADTARRVTEEQVFQPERKNFARILNTLFLGPLQLKHVKLILRGADFNDPREMAEVLLPFIQAGAVLPNDLRDMLSKVVGRKVDPLPEEFNLPIQLLRLSSSLQESVNVQKNDSQTDVLDILKDVRDVLEELQHGKN